MVVVIFEVSMKEGRGPEYFDLAAGLRPELEKIDGFISVERFESMATPGKYVSISSWRDDAAVAAWRAQADHQRARQKGREELFADYRIRVTQVIRVYAMGG